MGKGHKVSCPYMQGLHTKPVFPFKDKKGISGLLGPSFSKGAQVQLEDSPHVLHIGKKTLAGHTGSGHYIPSEVA